MPRGAEAHTVFRVPGEGGEELPRLQRGHPGRASAPEPARGRSGPHQRPACHAGSSELEGEASCRPQLRPGDKPEGRGQPDPRGPLGSAEAGVHMRSGAQGTATLASKGGGAQGGAQGRAQGSEGAALGPRPDRGRQPASLGEGWGRAGRRQSGWPGQGFWPHPGHRSRPPWEEHTPLRPNAPGPAGDGVAPQEPEPSPLGPLQISSFSFGCTRPFLLARFLAVSPGSQVQPAWLQPLASAARSCLVTPPGGAAACSPFTERAVPARCSSRPSPTPFSPN